jgi:hypothetical protein
MLGFIVAFMAVQLAIVLQWTSAASMLWLLFGMVGQSGILAYPWLSRYFGVGLAGRANTALNFLTFATAFLVQYLIGAIIDLWPTTPAGGYPPQAYQVAFGVFLGLQAGSPDLVSVAGSGPAGDRGHCRERTDHRDPAPTPPSSSTARPMWTASSCHC